MFEILIIVFSLLFLGVINDKYLDAISKRIILMYIILWGFVICASSLGAYGLYIPSVEVRIMFTIHVFAFVVGYRLIKIEKGDVATFNVDILNKALDKFTSCIPFKVISFILAGYVWTLVVKFFSILATANLADMRVDFYEGGMYGNLFDAINESVLSIFNIIAIPLFSWMLFYKRNILTIALGLFIFGYALLGGGRLGFLIVFVELIFVSICIFLTQENRKKRLKQLSILGCCLVFIIGILTSLRLDVDTTGKDATNNVIDATSEQIFSYAVGPVSAFDYALNNHYLERIHGYKYGRLTFSSVEAFIYTSLHKLGIEYDKALTDLVAIKQEEYIKIGYDTRWNALYTTNLYYYLDFGYWGIILFPFMFGMLFRYILKLLYKSNSMSFFLLLSYVFSVVILSFVDFRFVKLFPFLLVVILYIIGRRSVKGRSLSTMV